MDLEDILIPAEKLAVMETEPEAAVLGPILRPSVTFLHAPAGVGKTLFVMEIAISVASGISLFQTGGSGPPNWKIEQKGNVLIVDGEMSLRALKERLKAQKQERDMSNMTFLTNVEYTKAYEKSLDISKRAIRDEITDLCVDKEINFLILDNLATLTGGKYDENSAKDQRPLNQWFSLLRESGISILFVHHDGKNKDQRGSSDRTTVVDLTIHLLKTEGAAANEAYFEVEFTKARWRGSRPIPFACKFIASRWYFYTEEQSSLNQLLDHMDSTGEWDWRALSMELNLSKSRIYQLRTTARDRDLWDDRWDSKAKKQLTD